MADKPVTLDPRIGGKYGNELIRHGMDTFRQTAADILDNLIQDGYLIGTIPPSEADELAHLERQEQPNRQMAMQGDPAAQRQLARLEELRK